VFAGQIERRWPARRAPGDLELTKTRVSFRASLIGEYVLPSAKRVRSAGQVAAEAVAVLCCFPGARLDHRQRKVHRVWRSEFVALPFDGIHSWPLMGSAFSALPGGGKAPSRRDRFIMWRIGREDRRGGRVLGILGNAKDLRPQVHVRDLRGREYFARFIGLTAMSCHGDTDDARDETRLLSRSPAHPCRSSCTPS